MAIIELFRSEVFVLAKFYIGLRYETRLLPKSTSNQSLNFSRREKTKSINCANKEKQTSKATNSNSTYNPFVYA